MRLFFSKNHKRVPTRTSGRGPVVGTVWQAGPLYGFRYVERRGGEGDAKGSAQRLRPKLRTQGCLMGVGKALLGESTTAGKRVKDEVTGHLAVPC